MSLMATRSSAVARRMMGRTSLIIEFLRERLGRRVFPCADHRAADDLFGRRFQMHCRRTALAPAAFNRLEDLRMIPHEIALLLRRKLHHAASFVRVTQRREDLL